MRTAEAAIPAQEHRGPSLVAVGTVFAVLFIASLVAGTAMAGGVHFPSPFQPAAVSLAYFAEHPDAVRLSAFLQFGAAIPLGIFTATAVSRLRFLGVNVAGPSIAQFGGIAASVLLAVSALMQWALTQPGVTESAGVVRALHLLAFGLGGPGVVVPSGLLLAGISTPAGLYRFIPRWLMWFGLVIAAMAELSALSLIVPAFIYLLLVARFPSLVWIVATSALLPKSRRSRVPASAMATAGASHA